MCGTKYWYQYSVPLLSPTHLQGDEDGSNGECPVGQSRLAQQSATRGGKRIRKEKKRFTREEKRENLVLRPLAARSCVKELGIVDQTTVLLHSSPPKPSHAVPRPLGP